MQVFFFIFFYIFFFLYKKSKCGTIAYMAPEALELDSDYEYKVDIWALGVVAHELLVGARLF